MILEINSVEQAVNALDTIKKYLESNIKSIVSPRIGEPFYVDLGLPYLSFSKKRFQNYLILLR